jgi:AcrR family transcriptional regulator
MLGRRVAALSISVPNDPDLLRNLVEQQASQIHDRAEGCETVHSIASDRVNGSGAALPLRGMQSEGARREEIIQTAGALFASSGIRTSLHEIAEASGILPGSLYHHFESKEAIVLELVQRYNDDLQRIAKEARDTLHEPLARPTKERVLEFGRAIATVGLEHRAALLLTLYEPPVGIGEETGHALKSPSVIHDAMEAILLAGRARGEVRSSIDVSLLSDRVCQSMLHGGVGMTHLTRESELVPDLKIRILLDGLAAKPPPNTVLDRSKALRAARGAISTWAHQDEGEDDRMVHLLTVARAEFGRRGYEATTMRDIASAAGLSVGAVYRLLRSKDELLTTIMSSYVNKVVIAWDAVVQSESSPLSKIDALMWVTINVIHTLSDEFKVMLAWFRQTPPSSATSLGPFFPKQLRHLRALVAEGSSDGEIQLNGASADIRARCILDAIWGAGAYAATVPPAAAHGLARDTVIRGATPRT